MHKSTLSKSCPICHDRGLVDRCPSCQRQAADPPTAIALGVIRIPEAYLPDPDGRIVRVSPAYQVRERDGWGHPITTFRSLAAAELYAQENNTADAKGG